MAWRFYAIDSALSLWRALDGVEGRRRPPPTLTQAG